MPFDPLADLKKGSRRWSFFPPYALRPRRAQDIYLGPRSLYTVVFAESMFFPLIPSFVGHRRL